MVGETFVGSRQVQVPLDQAEESFFTVLEGLRRALEAFPGWTLDVPAWARSEDGSVFERPTPRQALKALAEEHYLPELLDAKIVRANIEDTRVNGQPTVPVSFSDHPLVGVMLAWKRPTHAELIIGVNSPTRAPKDSLISRADDIIRTLPQVEEEAESEAPHAPTAQSSGGPSKRGGHASTRLGRWWEGTSIETRWTLKVAGGLIGAVIVALVLYLLGIN